MLCDSDDACKGYVQSIVNPNNIHCQIATTSTCPDDCRGPYNSGNVGSLVPALNCAKGGYTGCFIKDASKWIVWFRKVNVIILLELCVLFCD